MDGWDPNIIQLACLSILELFLLDCLIPWVPGYWCSGNFQTHVYRRPAVFSKPLIFATAFMSFFSVVIALFKVCDVLIWENVDQINLNIVVIFFFLKLFGKIISTIFLTQHFFFGSKWILYRMYLILKETKHLGSELLLYVWVKSGLVQFTHLLNASVPQVTLAFTWLLFSA